MEKALNYSFERRSASFMEWFYETIKSETYFEADAVILTNTPISVSS